MRNPSRGEEGSREHGDNLSSKHGVLIDHAQARTRGYSLSTGLGLPPGACLTTDRPDMSPADCLRAPKHATFRALICAYRDPERFVIQSAVSEDKGERIRKNWAVYMHDTVIRQAPNSVEGEADEDGVRMKTWRCCRSESAFGSELTRMSVLPPPFRSCPELDLTIDALQFLNNVSVHYVGAGITFDPLAETLNRRGRGVAEFTELRSVDRF
ncbi:hypothetical protein C8Q77DRAFT_1076779 [Trametes polyzona]|nr:hypothetical protein C8Q77DRAFT_1076779 [Trametes polyzona]